MGGKRWSMLALEDIRIGKGGMWIALVLFVSVNAAAVGQGAAKQIDFNREVRPILAENCFACHGSDSNKRQAGLRLDIPEGAVKTLASGRIAIVGGDVKASEAIERILRHDALQMPPATSTKKLTPKQIETLQKWVLQDGKYAPHWAYLPVVRYTPPTASPTTNAYAREWHTAQNLLDRFILARLQKEGLHFSPPADRATLIRRLSLDLTGLPPTPPEVASFVHDTRPAAYEKLVDRLLASPHYGERMALPWLDMVRYADTVGYHGDQNVLVWPYRDYVIRAFNQNKPFDAFTREQLAGDLLPNATDAQRIASGYNRLGMMSAEGGVQDKEYRAKYFADRVRNASVTWLGATLGCAECHDHKFDPYSQKDFYRFGAFFADLNERGFYGGADSTGEWGPRLAVANSAQKSRLTKLEADIAAAKQALAATPDSALSAERAAWETRIRALDTAKALRWMETKPIQAASSGGSTLTIAPDGIVSVSGKFPAFDVYTVILPATQEKITAVRLEALYDESLAGNGFSRAGFYFVMSDFDVAVQRDNGPLEPVKLASVAVNGEAEGFPGGAAIDSRPETGWANPSGWDKEAVFRFEQAVQGGAHVRLVIRIHHEAKPHLAMGKFRLTLSSLEQPDLGPRGIPDNILAAIRKDPAQRTPAEAQTIVAYYRKVAPALETARNTLAKLETDHSLLLGEMPKTLVSVAGEPRTIRVLPRGNWMNDSGEIVQPGVPHFLRQIDTSARASRLDLANWIVSPENPLTARVFVNRLWKLYFGVGLVKNLDDFGVQAELPEHPELLDWLASEFVRSGWNIKHMARLMVTCHTYQQSSRATPALLERDPYNRLYARQTPVRLDAEFVRDVALKTSGLLTEQLGGPSAHPYQPRGYLASLNFPRREWAADAGADLYRRGLYTFWQRTFVHPSLLAFDAPTREEGACTRTLSNTPMQALTLMNDPIFVEAARVFAARILHQGGHSFASRLEFAYQTALSRSPKPQEIALLRKLYQSQHARYASDRKAAVELISIGDAPVAADLDPVELAAWTSLSRALLNLHETITRS